MKVMEMGYKDDQAVFRMTEHAESCQSEKNKCLMKMEGEILIPVKS